MKRGLISPSERATPAIRRTLRMVQGLLLGALLLTGLGPMLWLAKAAVTPTQDTLRTPLSLFPTGVDLTNLLTAWTRVEIDKYFLNTVVIAAGSWLVQLVVATTAGYALAILRPRYGRLVTAVVLGTLFVPAIVLLVPLYLTVVRAGMINTFWAVWLPAGASAFNVVLVQRFFANLPREVLEAARVDGAGPVRVFWSVVLPLSRPILGVVSVFAVVASWKDFLWPLLVLPDPAVQPLSVRLPALQRYVELDVFLAALAISSVIPVALFLVFQRLFLQSGALEGAVKG
ncbi:carbohydrate ABC transporter membrane protein 2, CUT1 family (TC 3.A.1.1.-) [Lentzea albidocapillata subsp. violacea]|uniref:Carbohydrate ABC transporter membrane protein 2, CUT1 family (TC 3.A.1.1.-) n=1 Tax=Lentzea albidocapillata subsp. violacea TaxID=128104 RepID=A0A1G8YUQ7_9PSEU|nr:carbohydrate ABC transporter membrane protein 2, CUT1 family (TC 3.A.1.1.-) [Lentzea albidocapillata subsp. violacea]